MGMAHEIAKERLSKYVQARDSTGLTAFLVLIALDLKCFLLLIQSDLI